jgi:hypothetical protein
MEHPHPALDELTGSPLSGAAERKPPARGGFFWAEIITVFCILAFALICFVAAFG